MRELVTPTKRRAMTRARAAKIFLREQGVCYLCGIHLRVGVDKYQVEHPDPLCLGGSDDDIDLRIVCDACHKAKTATDAASKAKRDRLVTAGWDRQQRSKFQSRGFAKAAPRKSATRPLSKGVGIAFFQEPEQQ